MQKGSQIGGALVTDEVIESSDDIFTKSRGGGWKGLQQFYSPPELAKLAAFVQSSGTGRVQVPVFDPTAGDGSLLADVDPAYSFGVEIDQDQIDSAKENNRGYYAVQGDLQNVFPLIYRAAPEFPGVWANPPFGLNDWSDETVNDGKPMGSARLTFIYSSRILSADGQLVFVCGKNQFHREIAKLPEAKGIYYVIECDDLFDGTSHPCAIAFGVHPELREQAYDLDTHQYVDTEGFEVKQVPRNMLDLVGPTVLEARKKATGRYNEPTTYTYGGGHRYTEAWDAIAKEYERRQKRAEGKKQKSEFDVELVGGKVLNVSPSAFSSVALAKRNLLQPIKALHRKNLAWFTNYERDWKTVSEAMEMGFLSVDPKVVDAVEAILHDSRRTVCPLYPIKPTQRLGYLTDLNNIKCLVSDPERDFVKGEMYPITTRTMTTTVEVTKIETAKRGKNAGEPVERVYEQQRKMLQVTIGKWQFGDSEEHQADIQYLIDHFELPDPGDVGSKYPVETESFRELLRQIEKDTIKPNSEAYAKENPDKPPVTFRRFQIEDLARLMVKKDGLIAWEQGLGKTLGGLAYMEACFRQARAQRCGLFVVPQDLIPQWQAEAKRFLGTELTLIKTHGEAKQIATKLRHGGEGLYITYYEALAVNGTAKSELLPEEIVETRTEYVKVKGTGRYGSAVYCTTSDDGLVGLMPTDESRPNWGGGWSDSTRFRDSDGNEYERGQWYPKKDTEYVGEAYATDNAYIPEKWQDVVKNITTKHLCPVCKSDRKSGWNGKFCRGENDEGDECGYSHYLHRVKPMGSLLSTAFKRGVIIVDELTMIQGDYSERSRVVRGLNARFKLGMTGTPVKNYIPQAFWLLWWTLGNASKRFPYDYQGKGDFENNHAVIQHAIYDNKKQNRKVLPEVTNLSQLWRLLASSIIRRRKEETGEEIVRKTIRPITVPLGEAQREQMEKWTKDFPEFFAEKYPDAPVVQAGAHEVMAPMLGLGMKLDYAATIPQGDPDYEWTGVEGVSDFTPANLRALEVTMALVKQGRKVLLGSQWIPTAKWFAERLEEKGVRAGHLLDANGNTAPPAKRAKAVKQFQQGDLQVLCVGIQAIRLGHNLDAASAAVINGLPWDWESFDQFIARIHRLTSKNPVDVYITIPGSLTGDDGTITRRKWDILRQKGDAASLALDGRLIEANEEAVSEDTVVAQMVERGIPIVGDEVPEEDVEKAWAEVAHISDFEFDATLLEGDAGQQVSDEMDAGEVAGVEDVGDQLEDEINEWLAAYADQLDATNLGLENVAAVEAEAEVEAPEDEEDEEEAAEFRCEACFVPLEDDEKDFCSDCEALRPQEEPMTVEPLGNPEAAVELHAPDPDPETPDETPAPAVADPGSIVQALKDTAELHTLGVLTDEEFAEAKAALIAQMKAPAKTEQLALEVEA